MKSCPGSALKWLKNTNPRWASIFTKDSYSEQASVYPSRAMVVYLVADYGAEDLAWAEVRQSLESSLGELDMQTVVVPAFDTHAAGFCVAQLALRAKAGDIVYHNVAPRREGGSEPEALLATKNSEGALIVGPGSGFSWSLLEEERDLYELLPATNTSQFRSRDLFPAAIGEAVRKLRKGPGGAANPLGEKSKFSPPAVEEGVVLYTDGYGNIKTSWQKAPLPEGTSGHISIQDKSAPISVAPGAFTTPEGDLCLLPGSSGPKEKPYWELFLRGGSAAEVLGRPPGGKKIEISK